MIRVPRLHRGFTAGAEVWYTTATLPPHASLSYTIKRSRRARCVRLAIRPDGQVVVTVPLFVSTRVATQLVEHKRQWIISHQKRIASAPSFLPIPDTHASYLKCRESARQFVLSRIDHYRAQYPAPIGRVSIRNQRTRWGSCSRSGNLNFNYKILFLPEAMADYIIVHELSHLQELNHSQKFWQLVCRTIPDYQSIRKRLQYYSLTIG